MAKSRWWKFVEKVLDGDSFTDAGRKSGFDKSAFTRWKNGAVADPAFAVKFARAYGVNVLQALVESGLITEDEAKLVEVTPALNLRDVPTKDLAAELDYRVKALNYLIELEAGATGNVTPQDVFDALSEQARSNDSNTGLRAVPTADYDDGTVHEFDWEAPHAADSSPDEDQLREERGEDPID